MYVQSARPPTKTKSPSGKLPSYPACQGLIKVAPLTSLPPSKVAPKQCRPVAKSPKMLFWASLLGARTSIRGIHDPLVASMDLQISPGFQFNSSYLCWIVTEMQQQYYNPPTTFLVKIQRFLITRHPIEYRTLRHLQNSRPQTRHPALLLS